MGEVVESFLEVPEDGDAVVLGECGEEQGGLGLQGEELGIDSVDVVGVNDLA